MEQFISCDWGTSSFRLRLVNAVTTEITAEIKTTEGIASTYNKWKIVKPEVDRLTFFSNIISEKVSALAQQFGHQLDHLTIVISGMASSNIGMIELPYAMLPFCTDGSALGLHTVPPSDVCKQEMVIVSGAQTATDVMRGEETILVGCNIEDSSYKQLFILPGTHSKHVIVQSRQVLDFKTFMTGEIFDILSTKSILATSVSPGELAIGDDGAFAKGVVEGASSNLLSSLFHVRTNGLFNYHTERENYQYLSGLLIGSELKEAAEFTNITLVTSANFINYYSQALQVLGCKNVKVINADKALIIGQCNIYKQLLNYRKEQ